MYLRQHFENISCLFTKKLLTVVSTFFIFNPDHHFDNFLVKQLYSVLKQTVQHLQSSKILSSKNWTNQMQIIVTMSYK